MSPMSSSNNRIANLFRRRDAATELAENIRKQGGTGMFRRFRNNKSAMFGMTLLSLLALFLVACGIWAAQVLIVARLV